MDTNGHQPLISQTERKFVMLHILTRVAYGAAVTLCVVLALASPILWVITGRSTYFIPMLTGIVGYTAFLVDAHEQAVHEKGWLS